MTFERLVVLAALLVSAAGSGVQTARASDNVDDLLVDGKFTFDARARYEQVNQEGFAKDASAPTVRARVGFVTGKVANFQGLIEGEAIVHLSDAFNDTVNGATAFPKVVDPAGMELNRLQLEYTGIPQTVVTLGRQRINLDNQRFVGAVGWRQNEQTFDALRVTNTSIDGLALTYIFVNQVNRIYGNESHQGQYDGPIHLFNAAYDWAPVGKIVGYAYLLDLDGVALVNLQSTATLGARVTGKKDLGDKLMLGYEAEYAHQNDYGNNPGHFDLNYWHGDLSLARSGLSALVGVESLEGDGVRGFSTPLATLHKFQGYADAFLTTPVDGIVDVYGKIGYEKKFDEPVGPITGFTAAAWYHGFDTERHSAPLGNEFDVEAVARLGEHFAIGSKYANLDSEIGAYKDQQKVWLYVEAIY
jgi:hypothetical protein